MKTFVKKKLLGVDLSIASEKEVLEYIIEKIKFEAKKFSDPQDRKAKFYIVTPNPELVVIANKDKSYKKVLNNANLALPDGVGIMWAGKVLGVSLKEKITGIGLVESLCRKVAKRPITVGFLGGRPQIAEETAECLKKRYFGLKIGFFGSEIKDFGDLKGTDVLFVAFGSPKQEFWIAKNLNKLPVRVAIGVGGAFDMISGKVSRAPLWVRNIGLEWLFRLIIQPWRIKRQLSLLLFIFLVIKEKFSLQ